MKKNTLLIESVLNGISPLSHFAHEGQFLASIGIDPDMPATDSDVRSSGLVRPTAMEKFSGSTVTGVPLWLVTNPKDANTYGYASDGKAHVISSSLTMSSDLTSPTSGAGNGAAYYDNYIYYATPTNVSRYGPLNGTPAMNQAYWGTTLSKTVLVDTTYPLIRGVEMPNHVMYRHTNDKLYFADVTTANKGVLHYIKTVKTTVEGDTDDGSTHTALDFGYGMYPTCMTGRDSSVVIGLIEGSSIITRQRPFALAVWDAASSSFQTIAQKEFSDPLVTALLDVNGRTIVFSGNGVAGCRISELVNGYSLQEIDYLEDSLPPLAGAVDFVGKRIAFGGFTTSPEATGSVYAIGSKQGTLELGLHNILKSTSAGANPIVTALKYVEHTSFQKEVPIIGWTDDSAKGLDKRSTTYGVSVFRTERRRIGREFHIRRLRIPLVQAVTTNHTATVKIYTDNEAQNVTVATINTTNFSGARYIDIPCAVRGNVDFFIEWRNTGTALLTPALPWEIDVWTRDTLD